MNNDKLILTAGKRFALFICVFILCFLISSFIVGVITWKWGDDNSASLRIATVLNNTFIFIIPALVTAVLITRTPASFLSILSKPNVKILFLSVLTLFVSMPMMSYIIEWNASIDLPERFSGIERWMKECESNAVAGTNALLDGNSIGALIISILIIGVFTGFSEELFFRGAMQKLFMTSRINSHVAVWCTAVIFSLMHFQFYGFIPRVLLGVFFGYLVLWSGSLWIAVIVHAVNNSFVVVTKWMFNNSMITADPNQITETTTPQYAMVTLSVVLTIIALYLIYCIGKNINQTSYDEK